MSKTNKIDEKYMQYAIQISGTIGEMLSEEDHNYHIDPKELQDGDNMTHFIHALTTVVPARMYNHFTNDTKNHLEFNHLANQLCFQYMRDIIDKEEEKS